MEMAVKYDSSVFSFIGESGMGYDWFAGTAVYRTEGKLGPYNTAVIINMGVNDLANVKRYAQSSTAKRRNGSFAEPPFSTRRSIPLTTDIRQSAMQ